MFKTNFKCPNANIPLKIIAGIDRAIRPQSMNVVPAMTEKLRKVNMSCEILARVKAKNAMMHNASIAVLFDMIKNIKQPKG